VTVADGEVSYTLYSKEGVVLLDHTVNDPYIFNLSDAPDRMIYIGLNRVIYGNLRDGKGVQSATIYVEDIAGDIIAQERDIPSIIRPTRVVSFLD